ncbi:hypothetical protein D770_22870 [Flammeovirgaceae bacterium 311]|nr:hypothetical protein D770_22870 [Flammeovirgaceae bacterium 311]
MDQALESFKKLNSNINIVEETEHVNITNLWNESTFMCRFQKDSDFELLKEIELPLELSAIYHKSEQMLEFIFAPLKDTSSFLSRTTRFYYKGLELTTKYDEPSDALKLLAMGFRETDSPSESGYRNLKVFRDFYRLDLHNSQMKTYFSDKKPYSFFIEGDFKKIKNDFIPLCKHVNVYSRFFDRKSPIIQIHNIEPKSEVSKLPCHSNDNEFPSVISASSIDPIALDLLQVAQESGSSRLRYLFYYQVLEYFAYYYLDEELKRKLTNLLKSPDILHNSAIYSRTIIEELKDYSNNTTDKQKLTKLVLDYLTVDDILLELKCNIKYFSNDLEFDGNFKLSAIISDEKTLDKLAREGKETKEKKKERDKLKIDLINSIADRIEKIRNVLVHIRESRENKVILPTRANNRKLIPYMYLIRRVSETISMRYQI